MHHCQYDIAMIVINMAVMYVDSVNFFGKTNQLVMNGVKNKQSLG